MTSAGQSGSGGGDHRKHAVGVGAWPGGDSEGGETLAGVGMGMCGPVKKQRRLSTVSEERLALGLASFQRSATPLFHNTGQSRQSDLFVDHMVSYEPLDLFSVLAQCSENYTEVVLLQIELKLKKILLCQNTYPLFHSA